MVQEHLKLAMLQLLRLAILGKGAGPDLMTVIELLGNEESSSRISNTIQIFEAQVSI